MAESAALELATVYLHVIPSFAGTVDAVSKEFGGAEAAADEAGDKAGKKFGAGFNRGVTGAAMVASAVSAFVGLNKIGETFIAVTDTIRIGTGATGDALEGLVDVAKLVGSTIPTSFEDAASVVADVNTRMGLSGDTLETVASQYLEAGRMLGSTIDIGATSAAFNVFGIEGDKVSGALDHLFQVSQATGIGMNELAASVSANGPAVQALGFGFEETAAMVGSFDKAGLNSGAIMSAMSKSLVKLAKDGEAPQDAFKRTVGELEGFIAAGDTASALDLAAGVFGTKGASQFIGAIEAGAISLGDLSKAAGQTNDTILGLGQEATAFPEMLEIFKNKLTLAIEPLASMVSGKLAEAMAAFMPYLESFTAWLNENQWVLGVVAGLLGVTLVVGLGLLTSAVWASTAALFASPITWVAAGVVLLIAAIVALVLNWDSVVKFLGDSWAGFVGWITDGLTAFGAWWGGIWQGVLDKASEIWTGIQTAISDIWNGIVAFFLAVHPVGIIISHWDEIVAFTTTAWNNILGFISGIWGSITGAVSTGAANVVGFFTGMGDQLGGFFGGLVSTATTWGSNVIQGLLDGLKSMGPAIGNFFGDLLPGWVTGPFAAALGIHSPSRVFMELGGHVGDGFLMGTEAKQDVIAKSMEAMVTIPTIPASSMQPMNAQAAMATGGDTFEIHPSADMDEQLLAEKISTINARKKRR